MTWTPDRLTAFAKRIRDAFLDKRIRSPVHLPGGNEVQVIEAFRDVRPNDWVLSGWRSMYHALLKGIPEEEVFGQILEGRSMYLCSREHKFLCSSIVGGILPIGCGLALAAKRRGLDERVHCFVGDMTIRTGLAHEFIAYCDGHRLPVRVIIEDNSYSTDTPTEVAWGAGMEFACDHVEVVHYKYTRRWPHVGCGEFVSF